MKNFKIFFLILLLNCFKAVKLSYKNKNINEEFILILAIKQNDIGKVKILIERGFDINYIHYNKSILEIVTDCSNLKLIEFLFERFPNLNNENIKNNLLIYASYVGNKEVVNFLIKKVLTLIQEGKMEIPL